MSRSKAEQEVYKTLLEKHNRKHPGCKLNQKVCRMKTSDECIGKGDLSSFMKGKSTCKMCYAHWQKEYYETVTVPKREQEKKLKLKTKKKRSVSFKKGTKRD